MDLIAVILVVATGSFLVGLAWRLYIGPSGPAQGPLIDDDQLANPTLRGAR